MESIMMRMNDPVIRQVVSSRVSRLAYLKFVIFKSSLTADFSKISKISRSFYDEIDKGTRYLGVDLIKDLCIRMSINPQWFLHGEGEPVGKSTEDIRKECDNITTEKQRIRELITAEGIREEDFIANCRLVKTFFEKTDKNRSQYIRLNDIHAIMARYPKMNFRWIINCKEITNYKKDSMEKMEQVMETNEETTLDRFNEILHKEFNGDKKLMADKMGIGYSSLTAYFSERIPISDKVIRKLEAAFPDNKYPYSWIVNGGKGISISGDNNVLGDRNVVNSHNNTNFYLPDKGYVKIINSSGEEYIRPDTPSLYAPEQVTILSERIENYENIIAEKDKRIAEKDEYIDLLKELLRSHS